METMRDLAVGAAVALILAAGPGPTALAAEQTAAPAPVAFEQYQLVLLKRPAGAPDLPAERREEIQRGHLAHLTRMWEEGHLLVAGPFGDQADESLRGAAIYRVGSAEEAHRLAAADPAVEAGRLAVEVVTWYVEEGYLAFPRSPPAPAGGTEAAEGETGSPPGAR
jgi:hypothetical protein